MRAVLAPAALDEARAARRESQHAFGEGRLILEHHDRRPLRRIPGSGRQHGRVLHLFERESRFNGAIRKSSRNPLAAAEKDARRSFAPQWGGRNRGGHGGRISKCRHDRIHCRPAQRNILFP